MQTFQVSKYRQILSVASFRNFWLGFLVSNLGDSMTKVALSWYVWEQTRSAAALGLMTFLYLGPVVVGGFLAGWLLDKFDKRRVMLADTIFRGIIVALIPILYYFGLLEVWHAYVVAAIYGFLAMIIWAGGPSIVPLLVEEEQLPTANALEAFAWTFSNVAGPALAGLLIAAVGAPNVVAIDAISYFAFALLLLGVHIPQQESAEDEVGNRAAKQVRYGEAFKLLLGNRIIAPITYMFFFFNIAHGMLQVWLPIFADLTLGGGAQLYGLLLAASSLGEVSSAFIAGALTYRISLGRLIALSQTAAGLVFLLLLTATTPVLTAIFLFLFGMFHGPLSIWAQTLRMRIIPPDLRGRLFALIRLSVVAGYPLGGALAGVLTVSLGIPGLILLSTGLMTLPGIGALMVRELRNSRDYSNAS
jgi:MFS family permease